MHFDIAKEVKARREALGLSMADLARMTDKKLSQINDLEKGRRQKGREDATMPALRTLIPIIEALGGELKIEWKHDPA